jgi:hypothetical protein
MTNIYQALGNIEINKERFIIEVILDFAESEFSYYVDKDRLGA